MQNDKEFRKNLADILTYFLHYVRRDADQIIYRHPEIWRQDIFALLQNWVIQLSELKLDIQCVKKIFVNMYRRSGITTRKHIITALERWSKNRKSEVVSQLGQEILYKLKASNYALPEKSK